MIRTTPRHPMLSAVQLKRSRHLLRPSPLQVSTKSLRQEATTHERRWPLLALI